MKTTFHSLGLYTPTNHHMVIATFRNSDGVLMQQALALKIEAYSAPLEPDSPVRIDPINEKIAITESDRKNMAALVGMFLRGEA